MPVTDILCARLRNSNRYTVYDWWTDHRWQPCPQSSTYVLLLVHASYNKQTHDRGARLISSSTRVAVAVRHRSMRVHVHLSCSLHFREVTEMAYLKASPKMPKTLPKNLNLGANMKITAPTFSQYFGASKNGGIWSYI